MIALKDTDHHMEKATGINRYGMSSLFPLAYCVSCAPAGREQDLTRYSAWC